MQQLSTMNRIHLIKRKHQIMIIGVFLIIVMMPSPSLTSNNLEIVTESQWTNLSPSQDPGLRNVARMVYDSGSDRILLFGGLDGSSNTMSDTWEFDYDNNIWNNRNPTISPVARYAHNMVYDSANDITILFGGFDGSNYRNDLLYYNYTVNTWVALTTTGGPSPRGFHMMTYDSFNEKVIIFGGINDSANLFDETWVYDFGTNSWTEMAPISPPNPRTSGAMVYDPSIKKAILFGGWDNSFPYGGTWTYDYTTDTWERLNPTEAPLERWNHAMVYDTKNQRTIMFGGYSPNLTFVSDIWAFDYWDNTWYRLNPTGAPQGRSESAMAYDTLREHTIIYGGWDGSVKRSETYRHLYETNDFIPTPGIPYLQHTDLLVGGGTDLVYSSTLRRDGSLCIVGETDSADLIELYSTGPAGGADGYWLCSNEEGMAEKGIVFGASGYDANFGIDSTQNNDVVLGGTTSSSTQGSVTRDTSDGGVTLFGYTFSGSSGSTYVLDIAVDSYDNILAVGRTETAIVNGLTITGGYDTTFNGGGEDGFLIRFDAAGAYVWGTYIGGGGTDLVESVVTDQSTNIWIKSYTTSPGLFTSSNAIKSDLTGASDYYIQKIAPDGTVLFATYYGGSGDERSDFTHQSAIDSQGNYIFSGSTDSLDFYTTSGALNETDNGGSQDGIIAKMDNDGNVLWSSYIGGNGADTIQIVEVDYNDNIIVGGFTDSTDIPIKDGFQITPIGMNDGVFFNISSDGSTLYYSSYIGTFDTDYLRDIEIREDGTIILVGSTFNGYHFPGYEMTGKLPSGWDIFISYVYPDREVSTMTQTETSITTQTDITTVTGPIETTTETLPAVTSTETVAAVTTTETLPAGTTTVEVTSTITSERTKTVGNQTETSTITETAPIYLIPIVIAFVSLRLRFALKKRWNSAGYNKR